MIISVITFLLFASLFVGSFLGVVITRREKAQQFLVGRSRCDHCGRPLAFVDLIPLLSWAWLKGRCRTCKTALGWFYPAVEAATFAVTGVTLFDLDGQAPLMVLGGLLMSWMLLTLAIIDLRTLLLPDWLTLPLVGLGLVQITYVDPGRTPYHLAAAGIGYGFFLAIEKLYLRLRGQPGLGRGDAKLLAAGGAWVGLEGLPTVLVIAGCAGLVLAVLARKPLSLRSAVPFGPGLALGIWLTWLLGPL